LSKRVLMVDDEQMSTRYFVAALEDAGFEVDRSDTTTRAVLNYNDDYYDLIVLDRMMPPGEVFNGSETETDLQTGYRVYRDLRRRWHLSNVPILILTNYYEAEQAEEMEREDERLRVRRKGTNLDELARTAREMTETYPVERKVTVIPMDEYPNVAPYYVLDAVSGLPVRLYFDRFREPEPPLSSLFAREEEWLWQFRPAFEQYLTTEDSRAHTLRAVLRESRSEEPNSVHALYYTGGEGRDSWHQYVLFEVAPWNRRDAAEARRLRRVGKALVARFIRECIYRYGHYEDLLLSGVQQFGLGQTNIGIAEPTKQFFLSLGFEPHPADTRMLRLPHDAAMQILQDVSAKPTPVVGSR
jgi:CheY-like chemotaxis protein